MTRMLTTLKQLVGRIPRTQGFFECRDCGTTVDDPSIPCPNCGSREIARYDLS